MTWGHKKEVLNTLDFKAITIYHDNPNVTQISKVRFSTCVTINKHIESEGEIRPLTIQKGIHAVGRFEIKASDIPKAWKNSCLWVIENGFEFRDGDYFEIYHNDHSTHPEQKIILDICIPLEKTDNIKLDKTNHVNLSMYNEKSKPCELQLDHHDLINYMKELRAFFNKEYDTYFKLGNIYQGNSDFSYFSLTTEELKKRKLKFVIILNHKMLHFTICLSGQNKSIRKKYWEMFKGSDWNKYHLVESIDDSLSIVDHIIVENPDFEDRTNLTEQIESESMKFIKELRDILN